MFRKRSARTCLLGGSIQRSKHAVSHHGLSCEQRGHRDDIREPCACACLSCPILQSSSHGGPSSRYIPQPRLLVASRAQGRSFSWSWSPSEHISCYTCSDVLPPPIIISIHLVKTGFFATAKVWFRLSVCVQASDAAPMAVTDNAMQTTRCYSPCAAAAHGSRAHRCGGLAQYCGSWE